MPMLKNLEMISGINYNKLQTKFAAKFAWKKGLQMKSNVWKPCRLTVQTCIGWASLEYLLKRIWKNLPLKIIIYCGTDQPLLVTAWFQRSVLNFKLSVLTFLRLMFDEHWAKNLWREIFQIHSMSNQLQCDSMCWSKYISLEFQCILSGLNFRLEQSENEVQQQTISSNLQILTIHTPFILTYQDELWLSALSSVQCCWWWLWIQKGAETLSSHLAILHSTWLQSKPSVLVSGLTHYSSYCFTLYFLSPETFLRRSFPDSDRVLNLKMNIQLPLFWSSWSQVRGQDSPSCAGLADRQWS